MMPSWTRIRRMVVKELRQLFRDPKTKRVIFVSPVVQLILFGYAATTDVRHVSTFVVDHDRSAASRLLVDAFTSSEYFRVVGRSDDPDHLREALDGGDARVGLWIPAGFASDLKGGRGPAVQIVVDGTNSNTATVAAGYAGRIVQDYGRRQAATVGLSGLPEGVDFRTRAWFNPALESRIYNVPAVVGVVSLLMCLLLTAMAVVREREVGTLEQLLVSPLTAGELMLGKTLPVAGIALVQIALVTAVALLWFQVPMLGSLFVLLAASLLFILAGVSAGLVISTLSGTQQEAFLVMFLFVMPAIILSGFFYPIDAMPEVFQWLTLANPLRHFLEVIRAIFLKGAGFGELWLQFVAMAVMGVAALVWATRKFRASIG